MRKSYGADEHHYTRDSWKPQKSFQHNLASVTFLIRREVVQRRKYLLASPDLEM